LGLMLLLCGASTALMVWLSYTQRDLGTALQKKDQPGYYAAILHFLGVVVIAAPLFAYYDYVQELLVLEWRAWLTGYLLKHYYCGRAYFRLKLLDNLDNPDQRICDDVRSFVSGSVSILAVICGKFLNCIAFVGVLWSISPRLVFFLLGYAALGTGVTSTLFGSKLTQLTHAILHLTADLRFSLVRARENAEAIAFYGGEAHESSVAHQHLHALVLRLRESILWARHLSLFTNSYHYITIVLPGLIVAPRYFAGELDFGVISQTGFAFSSIFHALTLIVSRFEELSQMAAQVARLDALLTSMEEVSTLDTGNGKCVPAGAGPGGDKKPRLVRHNSTLGTVLNVQALKLMFPGSSQPVWSDPLHLQLLEGQRLLIMGPSGSGKSTLLRAIAGLWEWGSGSISSPPLSHCSFIPQRTYMPLGSMRESLQFGHQSADGYLTDEKLESALQEVGLLNVVERSSGMDTPQLWTDMLSLGEQQRVAFARIFLRNTSFVFLDEATSAMDSDNEQRMYDALSSRVASYVSVGHQYSLVKFHTHVLRLVKQQIKSPKGSPNNDGHENEPDSKLSWLFQTIHEFREQMKKEHMSI